VTGPACMYPHTYLAGRKGCSGPLWEAPGYFADGSSAWACEAHAARRMAMGGLVFYPALTEGQVVVIPWGNPASGEQLARVHRVRPNGRVLVYVWSAQGRRWSTRPQQRPRGVILRDATEDDKRRMRLTGSL